MKTTMTMFKMEKAECYMTVAICIFHIQFNDGVHLDMNSVTFLIKGITVTR